MATYSAIYEDSTGDLLRVGYSALTAGTGETLRADCPFPGKVRDDASHANMHRWNGSAWVEVTNVIQDATATYPTQYAKADLPAASLSGCGLVMVIGESGSPFLAYSDGTDWRKVLDGTARVLVKLIVFTD